MKKLFFGLHLLVTLLAWVAPFLFYWKWLVPLYGIVMLQFAVFGRCLMNERHGLQETEERIFYTELLEYLGFQPNPQRLKRVVRGWLYPILAERQLLSGGADSNEPLLF